MNRLPENFFFGVGLFILVGVIVFISKNYVDKPQTHPALLQKGASIVKKSAAEALDAQQVSSPLLALTKINRAAAMLEAARCMASEAELNASSQLSLAQLQEDIEREQIAAQERLLTQYPAAGVETRLGLSNGFASGYSQQGGYQHQQQQGGDPQLGAQGGMGGGGGGYASMNNYQPMSYEVPTSNFTPL
jgi:hypothetical protein